MLQVVLLVGKFVFLAILYAFVIRLVRTAMKELKATASTPVPSQWFAAGRAAANAYAGLATGEGYAGFAGCEQGTNLGWKLLVEKSPCVAPGTSFFVPAGERVMAGRAPEMDIHLSDTFVSSKHALFEALPNGLVVEDLRSTNGTLVNGSKIVGPTVLSPGDRVEIGDTVFRVEVQ